MPSETPDNLEQFAEQLVQLDKAARRLFESRLKPETIYLLIHHAMPVKARVGTRQIKAVLDAARSIEARYVKPRKVAGKKTGAR